jgi:hypothetical protein
MGKKEFMRNTLALALAIIWVILGLLFSIKGDLTYGLIALATASILISLIGIEN